MCYHGAGVDMRIKQNSTTLKIKGVDNISEILMRMQMDFANKVQTLEEVQVINPLKEESIDQLKSNLENYLYSKLVYPRRVYRFTKEGL